MADQTYTQMPNAIRAAKKRFPNGKRGVDYRIDKIGERRFAVRALNGKAAEAVSVQTVGESEDRTVPTEPEEQAVVSTDGVPAFVQNSMAKIADTAEELIAEKAAAKVEARYENGGSGKAPKAGKGTTGAGKGRKGGEKDDVCRDLIAREGGATVAEIRAATGWKGVIRNGPERVARKAGKTLKAEGKGEELRFTLA